VAKLLKEIMVDVNFIKSHTLQPKWYKVVKIFILLGFIAGYYWLFGLVKTALFASVFLLLSLLLHMLYRVKTKKFQQTWLDFIVVEEGGEKRAQSIGKFYYSAIVMNAILAAVISQVLG
jgi:hypothetical protein